MTIIGYTRNLTSLPESTIFAILKNLMYAILEKIAYLNIECVSKVIPLCRYFHIEIDKRKICTKLQH